MIFVFPYDVLSLFLYFIKNASEYPEDCPREFHVLKYNFNLIVPFSLLQGVLLNGE